ncbi:hypothetical protein [Pseudomonas sp. S2_H01]|jgi:hypothetical protein
MPQIDKEELQYKYSWTTTMGDNPHLIHEDAKHLSRNEGYEMLSYLNNLGWSGDETTLVYGSGSDMPKNDRLRAERMIKMHFHSTSPGRGTVTEWLNAHWVH